MKWAEYQGNIIKRLIACDKALNFHWDADGFIYVADNFTIFRVPEFFWHIWIDDTRTVPENYLNKFIANAELYSMHKYEPMIPRDVLLINKNPVQVFEIPSSGERVRVNTKLYSKYTEKADQLTFWGLDRKTPVIAIHGETWDNDNIAFMVLPINYT